VGCVTCTWTVNPIDDSVTATIELDDTPFELSWVNLLQSIRLRLPAHWNILLEPAQIEIEDNAGAKRLQELIAATPHMRIHHLSLSPLPVLVLLEILCSMGKLQSTRLPNVRYDHRALDEHGQIRRCTDDEQKERLATIGHISNGITFTPGYQTHDAFLKYQRELHVFRIVYLRMDLSLNKTTGAGAPNVTSMDDL
jgi:hypothetical protein